MARIPINTGSQANDGTGDDLRTAMTNINTMMIELYAASPVTSQITIEGNQISTNVSNANLKLAASGTGTVEFEGIQIRDNRIEAIRSDDPLILSASGSGDVIVGALRIHDTTISSDDSSLIAFTETVDFRAPVTLNTLSSNDSSVITINDGLNISGDLIVNTIYSDDSTSIQINDSVNVEGVLTANEIDTNVITSTDSTAVTFSDDVNINGTLTATNITGVTALTRGDIGDGDTTTSSSTIANLDTFAAATYRSARYDVSITDSTNGRYALHTVYVVHDGSVAYINDTVVSSTGSGMATFTADIDSGNVRVRMVPVSSDSTTYKFVRTLINV